MSSRSATRAAASVPAASPPRRWRSSVSPHNSRIAPNSSTVARSPKRSPNGEVEVGIQQINVLLPVPGADYVGPLPGELQDYVLFSLGVLAVSKQQDAAKAFQAFAIAPESAALLRKSSMEPWRGR